MRVHTTKDMPLNYVECPLLQVRLAGRVAIRVFAKHALKRVMFTTRHMPSSKTLLGLQSKFRKFSLNAQPPVETLDVVAFEIRSESPVRSAAVGREGSEATCYCCGRAEREAVAAVWGENVRRMGRIRGSSRVYLRAISRGRSLGYCPFGVAEGSWITRSWFVWYSWTRGGYIRERVCDGLLGVRGRIL